MSFFRSMRTSYGSRNQKPLSDEEIQRVAPAIFAEDKHESRSERYTYIPTHQIVTGMRAEGFDVFSVLQGRSRIPGKAAFTKHLIRFRHRDEQQRVERVGDRAHEVCLLNSHDGTSAYQMWSGILELVCLNGMMVGKGTYNEVHVPHKGDVIGQVIEGAYTVVEDRQRIADNIARMSGIVMTGAERAIFARAAHTLRFDGQEHSPTPGVLLNPRRREDNANNLYRTLNVVQENVVRGGVRYEAPITDENGNFRRFGTRHTREVKAVDGSTSLNRALWTLAEEMAALKAAA